MTDIPTNNSNNPDGVVEPLPEDSAPPFSQPDPSVDSIDAQQLDSTHPATDSASDLDLHEQYDAGTAAAAEAAEPDSTNNVTSYEPSRDERNQHSIEDESL